MTPEDFNYSSEAEAKRMKEFEEYEKKLAAEGMPSELEPEYVKITRENPQLAEFMAEETIESAVQQYVQSRAFGSTVGARHGEHRLLAEALKSRFKTSKTIQELEDMIEEALQRMDRRLS